MKMDPNKEWTDSYHFVTFTDSKTPFGALMFVQNRFLTFPSPLKPRNL